MTHAFIDRRGRGATGPSAIPAPGWREIAFRTWQQFNADRIMLVAAGSTFYVFLALVPALAALVALYGLLFDPKSVTEQMNVIATWLPQDARTLLKNQLTRLTSQPRQDLGLAFGASLLISIWSASAATKSAFEGLNIVYDDTEKRSFLRFNVRALLLTAVAIVTVIAVLMATIALPLVLENVPLLDRPEIAQSLTLAGVAALVTGALIALYRWGPSRDPPQIRWLIPGAVLAIILLALTTALFSWYARTFGAYNAYGSIGSIIASMTWIWLSLMIVLLGGEFNAEIERQTVRDADAERLAGVQQHSAAKGGAAETSHTRLGPSSPSAMLLAILAIALAALAAPLR